MTAQANKDIVRRFYQALTSGNVDALDHVLAPEATLYFAGELVATGREDFKETARALLTSFPDWTTTIECCIAEGDKVAERVTSTGTHLGTFQGIPPTGRRWEMPGVAFFTIRNGLITENYAMPNLLGLLQQLGALPRPPTT